MTKTPIAYAVRVTTARDNDLLLILKCPFCGKQHVHGAGGVGSPFGAGDGPRLAHCGTGEEYDVREKKAA